LNLENHTSTCGFHSGCLKTWLYWNNKISIDDLKVDVIVLTTSMFINLKLHLLNEIIFSKIIKHVVVKTKQTYIERSSFHYVLYLQVNGSRYKRTSLRCCGIALDKPASWVNVCASSACSWSTPNDLWSLASMLQELTMILSSRRAIDFLLDFYTN